MEITRKTKLDIFNFLKSRPGAFETNDDGIIEFLNSIWDLRSLPSSDDRYSDAFGDSVQHLVNNSDWDYDYTFLDRFKLLDDSEAFVRFLEAVVSPNHRQDTNEIFEYVDEINGFLSKESQTLAVQDYDDMDRPIYKLVPKSKVEDLPDGLTANRITFYTSYEKGNSIAENITDSKAFVLKFYRGWNDYSYQSIFNLSYYVKGDSQSPYYIGEVKIISSDENNRIESVDNENYWMTKLPDSFLKLDPSYCSLGQKMSYYKNLKEHTGSFYESVLHAFRDAAYDTDIQDEFENVSNFKSSLIRYDDAERVMREAKLEMEGASRADLYNFTYLFKPKYAENTVRIDFEFNDDLDIPNRVCALIGKNGVGKTQILTSLPVNISNRSENYFEPRIPIFSKVIAVSYSAFDSFEPPKKNKNLNYIFCGIRDEDGNIISERSKAQRFVHIRKRIQSLSRIEDWRLILYSFLEEELVNEFIVYKDRELSIDVEKLNEFKKKLSSGESILFHSVADIIAHIRYDSLLLFDEPEMHLHPNAITLLMNMIYRIADRFKSFCIIATHSPLIIRELLSRNVFVVERENKFISVRKIGIESFGENLTILTEEVFGNREVPKQYRIIIQRLLNEGMTVDQVVESIETDNRPVSLNTRIFIESLASNLND